MPIRWRLTLFIALAIGAILLILGVALYFLLRDALLSNVEDTARGRAVNAARSIRSGETLHADDVEELTLDGVFVIIRDANGGVLQESVNLPSKGGAGDSVWRRALASGEPASGTAAFSGDDPAYIYAVPVNPPHGRARVVEAGKSYESALEGVQAIGTILAAGIGVAFVLSIGGAYLLARAALRPVEAVTAAAREMGEGDLARRLPVANARDEIGRLTATINGLLARLDAAFRRREEALSRQRRFAADASHELRTPLTSISGHARMLDEWALEGDKETARRSVEAIRREAGRMRGLVESLLTLTRGDEGAPMEVGRYDLGALAREATEAATAAACGRVSVEFVPAEEEVVATFDRDRIMQVASILLENAVKYTPDGGSVTVRVEEEDDNVALAVSDTGVGIFEDQLPLVFERFYRADTARAEGGAGLGLSIARQIAEAHGGSIEAESKVGQGSTFVLSLPRQKAGARTGESEDRA
ncbi:MAG: cell wall metabolism sensor histidine kinase WalK [Actinomycetota bacterium]|nr:cell wall metabolism sensor histidine kinase WalK [Actinomycetota bacterium]